MLNPQADEIPTLDTITNPGALERTIGVDLATGPDWTAYYVVEDPEPEPMDPDTAVMLEIIAHDTGAMRGLFHRLEDNDDAIGRWYAERSPCGIHLHPRPVTTCGHCPPA